MRFPSLLLLALFVTRPAVGGEPRDRLLPPPPARAEPRASSRAPVEERRPWELLAHGRAWAPLSAQRDPWSDSAGLGAAVGVGFRTSPYFSVGGEASTLRARAAGARGNESLELAAVGRVYMLEAGILDPYLELALGYEMSRRRRSATRELVHGSSARAGGGLDLVVVSPLRIGVLVSYREVARFPGASCSLGCRVSTHGGVLTGLTVTLPLGQPL